MKNVLRRVGRVAAIPGALMVGVTAAVLAMPGLASADSIDTGFTSATTTITGYLTDAVALVLAVLGLGLGIRMIIKWVHRGVSAT